MSTKFPFFLHLDAATRFLFWFRGVWGGKCCPTSNRGKSFHIFGDTTWCRIFFQIIILQYFLLRDKFLSLIPFTIVFSISMYEQQFLLWSWNDSTILTIADSIRERNWGGLIAKLTREEKMFVWKSKMLERDNGIGIMPVGGRWLNCLSLDAGWNPLALQSPIASLFLSFLGTHTSHGRRINTWWSFVLYFFSTS